MKDMKDEVLFENYKMKAQYLVDNLARAWNRFNYFLTLHTAISAGLFTLMASEKSNLKPIHIAVAVTGLIFAIFWYIFGAQDKYLIEIHYKQVNYAQSQVEALKDQPRVGAIDDIEKLSGKVPNKIYQWRLSSISNTKLLAFFPLVIVLYWLVLIVIVVQ